MVEAWFDSTHGAILINSLKEAAGVENALIAIRNV